MKLELKHITPYLPYELKILNTHRSFVLNLKGIQTDLDIIHNHGKTPIKFIKPILRPLSDLTKETTINGNTFIPIYKLFELEYKGTVHLENIRKMYFEEVGRFISCSHLGTAMSTSINVLNPDKNNYWKIQKLHEWHFDTNALINEGLAIDVNTLN